MVFAVNKEGNVVILKASAHRNQRPDRFEAARGKADVKWRTDELMALLRGEAWCRRSTSTSEEMRNDDAGR